MTSRKQVPVSTKTLWLSITKIIQLSLLRETATVGCY